MQDKDDVWSDIVAKHHLQEKKLEDLVTWWEITTMGTSVPTNLLSDMSKSRNMGFHEYISTEKSYFNLFDYLWHKKYIPKPKYGN